MRCIECGAVEKDLLDYLCYSCYSKRPLVKEPKKFIISYCNNCKKFFAKNKHMKDLNEALKPYLAINEHAKIKELDASISLKDETLSVHIVGFFDFAKRKLIEEEFTFPIDIKHFMCDDCKAKTSRGYTAIIQLRNRTNKNFDRIIARINQLFENQSLAHIIELKELDEGIDFYVIKTEKALAAAKQIIKEYGGIIDVTKKIFSVDKQTSKELYRTTILVRLFDFSIHDLIFYRDSVYEIVKFVKEKIICRNIYTSESKTLSFKDGFEIIGDKNTRDLQIISTKPGYKILNPEYEPVILKTCGKYRVNDVVKVYLHENIGYDVS